MRRPRLRGGLAVLAGLVLVVAAWGVLELAPSTEAVQAPIPVRVGMGERGEGRNIAATVLDVVIAERLTDEDPFDPWNGETTGQWIVVNATVESTRRGGSLDARLELGSLSIIGSGRPPIGTSLQTAPLEAGIQVTGWVAFEVPADAPLPSTATIRIAEGIDSRLDSVITVRLDLAGADRVGEFVLPDTETAAR